MVINRNDLLAGAYVTNQRNPRSLTIIKAKCPKHSGGILGPARLPTFKSVHGCLVCASNLGQISLRPATLFARFADAQTKIAVCVVHHTDTYNTSMCRVLGAFARTFRCFEND